MRSKRVPMIFGIVLFSASRAFSLTLVNSFSEGYNDHYTIDTFTIDLTAPAHISSEDPIVDDIISTIGIERPSWLFTKGTDLAGTFTVDRFVTVDYGTFDPDYRNLGLAIKGRAEGTAFDSTDIILYESTTQTIFGFPFAFKDFSSQSLLNTDPYYPFHRSDNPRNGSTGSGAYNILWNFEEGMYVDKNITIDADRTFYMFFGQKEVSPLDGQVSLTINDGIQYRFVETAIPPPPVPAEAAFIPFLLGLIVSLSRRSRKQKQGALKSR